MLHKSISDTTIQFFANFKKQQNEVVWIKKLKELGIKTRIK